MTIKITPQLPRVINKGLNSTSKVLKITKIKKSIVKLLILTVTLRLMFND